MSAGSTSSASRPLLGGPTAWLFGNEARGLDETAFAQRAGSGHTACPRRSRRDDMRSRNGSANMHRGLTLIVVLSIVACTGCTSSEKLATSSPSISLSTPSPSVAPATSNPSVDEPLHCPEDRNSLPRLTIADVRGIAAGETVICPTGQDEPKKYRLLPSWDVLLPVDGMTLPGSINLTGKRLPKGRRPTTCTELSHPLVIFLDGIWFSARHVDCPMLL